MQVESLWCVFAQFLFIGISGRTHGDSAQIESMNVGVGNIDMVEQGFAGLSFIGLWIVDGNIAFVTEEDMNPFPVNAQGREILTLVARRLVETT